MKGYSAHCVTGLDIVGLFGGEIRKRLICPD